MIRIRASNCSLNDVYVFLLEMYASRGELSHGVPRSADISQVAEQLTREGTPVRLVRSIVVPDEETCFYLFQAQTADAVREAAARAGLRFDRVVQATTNGRDESSRQNIRLPSKGEQP